VAFGETLLFIVLGIGVLRLLVSRVLQILGGSHNGVHERSTSEQRGDG
jgi:hypothetical protein